MRGSQRGCIGTSWALPVFIWLIPLIIMGFAPCAWGLEEPEALEAGQSLELADNGISAGHESVGMMDAEGRPNAIEEATDTVAAVMRAVAVQQAETYPYECDNGWVLEYAVNADGTATIADVSSAGSTGTVVVPASIEGHDVTAIGQLAFYNEGGQDFTKSMTGVVIPDSVQTLGASAFMGSGLQSVAIPASVAEIPATCFAACADLADVVFEGESIGSFGDAAFSGCVSIKRLDIPVLSGKVGRETYSIGRKCFNHCESLETIVFHGDVNTKSNGYISKSDCFEFCTSLKNLVYYCERSLIPRATGSDATLADVNEYMTLWFYSSEADAAAASNPVGHITCHNSTKILDILSGNLDRSNVKDASGKEIGVRVWDESGPLPDAGVEKVWGVRNHAITSAYSKLSNTHWAVPVTPENLDYGWVTSKVIDDFNATNTSTSTTSSDYPKYYLGENGQVEGLDGLTVYSADGNVLDSSLYKLCFQMAKTTGSGSTATTTYETVEDMNKEGSYRIRAEGASQANRGTATGWTYITVQVFKPIVKVYDNADVAINTGNLSQFAAKKVKGNAKCAVVVPASDWRYQVIGSALAGVGGGILLFDNKDNYSSRAVVALAESGVTAIEVVGSLSIVPESPNPSSEKYLMDFISERNPQYKTRYAQDKTIQELADQVYATIKRLRDNDDTVFGDGWGTTAIVASPANWSNALPLAQHAYSQKAPLFFLQDDGMLSSTDLGYLKSGGFTQVLVAGGSAFVSDACVQAIRSACTANVERMLDDDCDSLGPALEVVGSVSDAPTCAFIANADDGASPVAAAAAARARGGIAFACAGTVDSKRIQDYLHSYIVEHGRASIGEVYLVGDFSGIDSKIQDRMASLWETPLSTKVGKGDTFAGNDYAFTIAAGSTVTLTRARNANMASASIGGVTWNKTQYTVSSIAKGAFADCKQLRSVTFRKGATGIGASAFSGHPSLTKVSLGSYVTSISASAFSGCKVLTTVSGSKVAAIGSSAFARCPKLKTCAALKTATMIGAGAFMGCSSLLSVRVAKATSVGKSAFKGCTRLVSATFLKANAIGALAFQGCAKLSKVMLSSAGLSKIGAKAFYGCKSLKTLKVHSKKLVANKLGGQMLKGTTAKLRVSVPSDKVKSYKKMFLKRGLPKKALVMKMR